jgi:hypothetical protein
MYELMQAIRKEELEENDPESKPDSEQWFRPFTVVPALTCWLANSCGVCQFTTRDAQLQYRTLDQRDVSGGSLNTNTAKA